MSVTKCRGEKWAKIVEGQMKAWEKGKRRGLKIVETEGDDN